MTRAPARTLARFETPAQTTARRPILALALRHEPMTEVKRVIVGQEGMLERVLVAPPAGGHVLLEEGVPGLAKTLTVKTVADVRGETFTRPQFTPDLVPAELVGTHIHRPDPGSVDSGFPRWRIA